jgi:catecholate siderophore receptor
MLLTGILCTSYAQSLPAILNGQIFDPAHETVSRAKITVTSESRGAETATASDQNGEFSLSLTPGHYTILIAAQGFSELAEELDVAPEGSSLNRTFTLQVAPVRQMVTVTEAQADQVSTISTATKTATLLRDIPQALTVVTHQEVQDQSMLSIGDVVRYIPGITAHQGENNRDEIVIRGNDTSASFFVDGVRDDVQYYRDLYNVERIEVLKGPNALMFGRGGGGGIINRVTKEPSFTPRQEFELIGGSHGTKRLTADFGRALTPSVAFRLNGLYEDSGSFRQYVDLERYGVNPTLTVMANRTRITFGYEHLHDYRVADRGITSFQGRPADVDISTYYGNPNQSHVRARVDLGSAMIEHQGGRLNIQSRLSFGGYDRGYQNFVPGVVSPAKTQVSLSAYNNATKRLNAFNQTNLTYSASTRRIRHTVLAGIELGRQQTDNFRNTGYFNDTATSITVPYSNPTISTLAAFRQSSTDPNNHLKTNLAATYVQDQAELSAHLQVLAGARFDYFDLHYHDNRTGTNLRRIDNLVSPRVGIVVKPVANLSIYGSYSVSYLPSSGDQFSSLTAITQQVKPEKFNNYEGGVKWDIANVSLTAAMYRLDRSNTRSTDPNDPTRIVQTGRTRTTGYEMALDGRVAKNWKIIVSYAYQDAFIASATTSARAAAQVPQVPHHNFSIWNNYQIVPRLGAGLGIIRRSDMFAAVDNTVTLPGYTRADFAIFVPVREKMRLQANVENVFNRTYYVNADNNTNISPGAPRALRIGLTTRF